MKRQLNKDEKKISEASLLRLREDLITLTFQKEYLELMHNKGIKANYFLAMKENRRQYGVCSEQLKQTSDTIAILEEQIKTGVETKEVKNG